MEKTKALKTYIEEMNKVSVYLITEGVIVSCLMLLLAVILFHIAPAFSSPARIIILSEAFFKNGSTLFLTAPIIGFVLDMFIKALKGKIKK